MLKNIILAVSTLCLSAQVLAVDDGTCQWKLQSLKCEPSPLCSYQYRFGDLTPSQSCRLRPTYRQRPQQIHLAYAGKDPGTGMTISWGTYDKIQDAQVWIGTSPEKLVAQSSISADIRNYYSDKKYSFFSYHVTVNDLTPATTYFYRVGSASKSEFQSEVGSFTTGRSNDDTDSFQIAVYGDLGGDKNALDTIELVSSMAEVKEIDFVYHVGDISYADNAFLDLTQLAGFFYEEAWNKWMNDLVRVMGRLPYMVLVGNHEAECHDPNCQVSPDKVKRLSNYTAYNARFKMPSEEVGGVQNMWYSFEHGPVHFTSISSETDYKDAPSNDYTLLGGRVKNGNFGNQLKWLEEDLKKAHANRDKTPWLIVGMHRPIYGLNNANGDGTPKQSNNCLQLQKAFEELFIKYEVDVVVAGHRHAYERHLPIARSKPVLDGVSNDFKVYENPKAPVYIVTGAAGNSEGHKATKNTTAIPWNAAEDHQTFGINTLKVTRNKLEWKFISSTERQILDEFVMIKN